ncbi:MAG: hypothetical protein NTZ38_03440, partial [Candidatus Taylorbacteria bacterium]|nr:hypothetical protein [Candidatus Taylorbacteria bacterium]
TNKERMTTMENLSIASVEKVSEGQIETSVTLVVDATRKATGTALRDLAKRGVLTKQNIERVRARGNEIVAAITALVKEKFAEIAENITGYVKLIFGAETLELDETDGQATIAKAKDTFPGWIDPDFREYGCDVESESTKKTQVTVHEMIKDGTFARIFNGMSDDLNSLCLTQPQIIQFVEKHKKWLRTDGYATFFLFKVGEEIFVALVYFGDVGELEVCAYRFSDGRVWHAEYRHRVVVPQLALAN